MKSQTNATHATTTKNERPHWASRDPLMQHYHDTEWGRPIRNERGLFEKISLEAFQSGLSWATILRKRPAFREAFANFEPDRVAAFTQKDVEQLLANERIVRNRRKIEATINNARATIALRENGGLVDLVWSYRTATTPPHNQAETPTQSPGSVALSQELKKQGFVFVGPTTMYAMMQAVGISTSEHERPF